MNKKIAISGYYGFNNAGDEAVLYAIVTTLRELDTGIEIIVLSNDPDKTAKLYQVKAVNRWKMGEVYQTLKQVDLLISGGGSLLQDVTGTKSIIYYLAIVKMAKFLKKPVIFYAQGIGPVTKPVGKLLMRLIANRVDVITVRDENSKTDLHKLKVTKPPIYVTADPVLGISPQSVDLSKGREILVRSGIDMPPKGEKAKVLAVSVRDWKGLTGFKEELAKVCDDLSHQGWQVVFLPMHFPDDIAPSREIAKLMEEKAVVLKYNFTVEEVISIIGNADLLIGMRLHSLIMAAVMHVPFVGVSYDPKVDRFMERVGAVAAGHVSDLKAEQVHAQLNRLLEDLAGERIRLERVMGDLRALARESARQTLRLLT